TEKEWRNESEKADRGHQCSDYCSRTDVQSSSFVRKQSVRRKGIDRTVVRPMPSGRRASGLSVQFKGTRSDLGRQQISASLADSMADRKRSPPLRFGISLGSERRTLEASDGN